MSHKQSQPTPSEERQKDPKGETLREKATKKLHGKDANPSQLGDPISVKAETSSTVPTEGEEGSASGGRATENNEGYGSKKGNDDKLREKKTKEAHRDGANPSMLGDPISGKAETSDLVPTEGEEGARSSRDSKL